MRRGQHLRCASNSKTSRDWVPHGCNSRSKCALLNKEVLLQAIFGWFCAVDRRPRHYWYFVPSIPTNAPLRLPIRLRRVSQVFRGTHYYSPSWLWGRGDQWPGVQAAKTKNLARVGTTNVGNARQIDLSENFQVDERGKRVKAKSLPTKLIATFPLSRGKKLYRILAIYVLNRQRDREARRAPHFHCRSISSSYT